MTKIDLIAGCLSKEMLHEVATHYVTKHLVYLKLRIQDMKTLALALVVEKYLPNLLWLELKIDFPILKEDPKQLTKTNVSMMDIYVQGISDKHISKLVTALAAMHTRYTGIHVEDTALTPEGVFTLLKQLKKKNIGLYSTQEDRERFRRWYYPQLYTLDKDIVLTDEMALELLGFDDRKYYSNHFVGSSCFALALDAWNLMSYLEEEEQIVYFTYRTDNLSFIKNFSGSVTVHKNDENPPEIRHNAPVH